MFYDIVINTNVIIAALRSKRGASNLLLKSLNTGNWKAHISVPLLFEYEEICYRHLLDLNLKRNQLDDLLDYICAVCTHHKIFYLWRPYLKDADDDFLLELAVEANANYIVSFNKKDFIGIEKFAIEVLTPKEFLYKIGILP